MSCGPAQRDVATGRDADGNGAITISFARRDCVACERRAVCTRGQTHGRQLMLRPRDQHLALQAARDWQATEVFKAQDARRAGVEGTFTQSNRRSDLRHARYLGLAKPQLQHILTAVAINLIRVVAWLEDIPRGGTRTSSFAALMAQSSAGARS